jgi:hypothetical protein
MKLANQQPDNVCSECGKKWGIHRPKDHHYRIWVDRCDVCFDTRAVCDASEYGYLKEGWDGGTEVLCVLPGGKTS